MRKEIFAAVIATLMATTAAGAAELKGYLYTSLNGEETNQVVSFERYDDGTLGAQQAYSTGSLGGANRAAGGDAAGDFDSQGAMQIIGNYMLVVNAGGNTISVFAVDRTNGAPARMANVDSGGTRPSALLTSRRLRLKTSTGSLSAINGTTPMSRKVAMARVRSRCIPMPISMPTAAVMKPCWTTETSICFPLMARPAH